MRAPVLPYPNLLARVSADPIPQCLVDPVVEVTDSGFALSLEIVDNVGVDMDHDDGLVARGGLQLREMRYVARALRL